MTVKYDLGRIWKEVTNTEGGKSRQKPQNKSAVGRKRRRNVTAQNKITSTTRRLLVDKGQCHVGAATQWQGRAQNTSRKVQICVA